MKPLTHALSSLKRGTVTSAAVRGFFRYNNRQGALADGLHGLNPRITAHCYTPVQKATSVDLATGKAQRTSVVIKALCISEQIRHAHLGLFVYLIHLRVWRGKEEMALSTLGELWSKGIELNKEQAHELLNRVKLGFAYPMAQINDALLKTGDLDVFRSSGPASVALRKDGYEPRDHWTGEAQDQGIGVRRLQHVVRYWIADQSKN